MVGTAVVVIAVALVDAGTVVFVVFGAKVAVPVGTAVVAFGETVTLVTAVEEFVAVGEMVLVDGAIVVDPFGASVVAVVGLFVVGLPVVVGGTAVVVIGWHTAS